MLTASFAARTAFLIPVLAVTIVGLVACQSAPVEILPRHFEGTVVAVVPTANGVDVVLGDLDPPRTESAVIWVRAGTSIAVREAHGLKRAATVDELSAGSRVAIEHSGPEYRSDPPQYAAVSITIFLAAPE
jgi:hypothetical protein